MRKIHLFGLMIFASILCFAGVERFFIGNIEVSKADYLAIDTALLRSNEVWDNGDSVRYIAHPGIYARIDSTACPGKILVVKRSDREIWVIDSLLNRNRTETAILKVGDTIPDFTFYDFMFQEREPWSYRDLLEGNVILLNFWATWCGPCVKELEPEHLPSLIEEFRDRDDFVFLPVSVNHSNQELIDFFSSPRGKKLGWIEYEAAWDKNGEFSRILSSGGIPLTILIDKDGVIRLNESGAFLKDSQKSRLKAKITELLQPM